MGHESPVLIDANRYLNRGKNNNFFREVVTCNYREGNTLIFDRQGINISKI